MNKKFIVLLLAASPMLAFAADQNKGWYVTPKFVYGKVQVKDKLNATLTDSSGPTVISESSTDSKFQSGGGYR
jgi:hypothetical protein